MEELPCCILVSCPCAKYGNFQDGGYKMAAFMAKSMWHACMACRLSSSWSMKFQKKMHRCYKGVLCFAEIHFLWDRWTFVIDSASKLSTSAFPRRIHQGVCTRNPLRSVHKESTKECAQGICQGVCTKNLPRSVHHQNIADNSTGYIRVISNNSIGHIIIISNNLIC